MLTLVSIAAFLAAASVKLPSISLLLVTAGIAGLILDILC